MKKGSRILLLLAVMLFCAVVFPVDAQAAVVASGECGENVSWTLDDAGTLTISGTGKMYDYFSGEGMESPRGDWGSAKKMIVEEGVTGVVGLLECPNLTSIVLPASVTEIYPVEIYGYFIGDLSNLTGIWVDEKNPVFSSDEKGVLYDDVEAALVRAPVKLSGSYTIRKNTKFISAGAFDGCKKLTNVVIPKSVTDIGLGAFSDTGLTSVVIPEGVTCIWEGAFNGCTSLKSVTIPESLEGILFHAFDCPNLKDVYYAGSPKQWAKVGIDEEGNEPLLNAKITFGKCDHNYNSGVVTKKATCKEEGVKTFTCSICKGTRTEKIAKLTTHSYDDGVITTDPTCKEEGVKTFTCTVCAKSYTEKIEKLTEHSYDDGVITTEPTCKETGIMTFTCTICEDSFTEDTPKLTTHTYDEGVVTKASTCKEEGIKTFTCTVCDVKKTEPIEKTDVHTYAGGVCAICGSSDPNYAPIVDEPEPDDPVNDTQKIVVIAVVAVSIVLIGAVCLFFFFSRDKGSDDSHS